VRRRPDLNTGAYDACTLTARSAVLRRRGGRCGRRRELRQRYNEDTYAPGPRRVLAGCGGSGWRLRRRGAQPALGVRQRRREHPTTAYGLTACREDCTIGRLLRRRRRQRRRGCDRGGLNGASNGPSPAATTASRVRAAATGSATGRGVRRHPWLSASCTLLPICGDGLVAASAGEQCDWGRFASDAYGACTTSAFGVRAAATACAIPSTRMRSRAARRRRLRRLQRELPPRARAAATGAPGEPGRGLRQRLQRRHLRLRQQLLRPGLPAAAGLRRRDHPAGAPSSATTGSTTATRLQRLHHVRASGGPSAATGCSWRAGDLRPRPEQHAVLRRCRGLRAGLQARAYCGDGVRNGRAVR
jgi:hypothetical protein